MANHRSRSRSKTKKMKQEDSDHQSGALVGSNDDLLTEILIRLPVTSILRFKSVSKHWRSLLTHTHFTHRYDKQLKSPGLFARHIYVPFDVENRSTPTPSLRGIDDPYGILVLQSCNGLFLCCDHPGGNGGDPKYYVFNPTTKQVAIIPSVIGGKRARKTIYFMGLAFHQTDCAHYKLVCVRALKHRGELFQIQVYSSLTRKWKISIEFLHPLKPLCGYLHEGVYWNGAVHWAPDYTTNLINYLYFKIDDEELGCLPLPDGLISSKIDQVCFGESRGHLHLTVYTNRGENSLHMNVYELLSDRSGWFVKYKIELDELPAAFPEMFHPFAYEIGYAFDVIDVIRGEEEQNTFMVLRIGQKVITYNVHDHSFKQTFTLPRIFYNRIQYCRPFGDSSDLYFSSFHRYTETLTSF